MTLRWLGSVATLGVFVAFGACAGGATARADRAASGRALYKGNCSRCHGFDMLNPAPGVFDLRTFPASDEARFLASVSEGRNAMPAWKAVLSTQEIEALWSYVSGASATP